MICYSYIDRFERKSDVKTNKPVKEIFSDAGSNIGKTYNYKIVEGKKMLVEDGECNRQDLIDSFALEGDITYSIQRFLNGDSSVVNPSEGVYGDFSSMPTTYADLFDRLNQCRNIFDSMPVEIRKEFDNSPEKFWSEFGSDQFNAVFDKFNGVDNKSSSDSVPVPTPIDESEVK